MWIDYLIFAASVLAATGVAVGSNFAGKRLFPAPSDVYRLNVMTNGLGFVLFAILAIGHPLSFFSVWFGAVFGALILLSGIFNVRAYASGPMHITMLLSTSSMLIPALSGCLFFDESFSLPKLFFALALIGFIFLFLAPGKKEGGGEETEKKESRVTGKWLLYVFLNFAVSGSLGVLQKVQQASVYREESNGFLMIAFLFAFLFALCMRLRTTPTVPLGRNHFFCGLVIGLSLFVAHAANLYLSGAFPSQLVFPVINGLPLIFTTLIAVLFFHEPLNRRQLVGLVGGVFSILCITCSDLLFPA